MLEDNGRAVVIDVPLRDEEVKATLVQLGVKTVDAVLVSHADADHIGGVLSLLTDPDFRVAHLYLNADTLRGTAIWQDLRVGVKDARARDPDLRVHLGLTTDTTDDFQFDTVDFEILAPSPELAMSGAGGQSPRGRPLTANSVSAVIRVRRDGTRGVLLAGDIDATGLDEVLEDGGELEAEVLVFPHHGGRAGAGTPSAFADRLCDAVGPDAVVFSLGRGQYDTPRPDIIDAIRSHSSAPHIACTQLSERCAAALPGEAQTYLSDRPARGKSRGRCCAGTWDCRFTQDGLILPQLAGHAEYVRDVPPTALCQGRGGTLDPT